MKNGSKIRFSQGECVHEMKIYPSSPCVCVCVCACVRRLKEACGHGSGVGKKLIVGGQRVNRSMSIA